MDDFWFRFYLFIHFSFFLFPLFSVFSFFLFLSSSFLPFFFRLRIPWAGLLDRVPLSLFPLTFFFYILNITEPQKDHGGKASTASCVVVIATNDRLWFATGFRLRGTWVKEVGGVASVDGDQGLFQLRVGRTALVVQFMASTG